MVWGCICLQTSVRLKSIMNDTVVEADLDFGVEVADLSNIGSKQHVRLYLRLEVAICLSIQRETPYVPSRCRFLHSLLLIKHNL